MKRKRLQRLLAMILMVTLIVGNSGVTALASGGVHID